MNIIIPIISILIITLIFYFANKKLPFQICPICAGVALTWVWFLAGMYFGLLSVAQYELITAILMGASIGGVVNETKKQFSKLRNKKENEKVEIITDKLKSEGGFEKTNISKEQRQVLALEKKVLPEKGVVLPVKWGNLGVQLVESGVIDSERFKALYVDRGAFTKEYEQLLSGENNGKIKITKDNAGYLLNMFWALGLAQKSSVLEEGEMMTYSGAGSPAEALAKAGNFASTGGWTLAEGNAMDHYSRHPFIILTPEQQK